MHRVISQELVSEWHNHPVTEALKAAVRERIQEASDKVMMSSDPDFDRFIKGMVHAFKEVLDMEIYPTDGEVHEVSSGDFS